MLTYNQHMHYTVIPYYSYYVLSRVKLEQAHVYEQGWFKQSNNDIMSHSKTIDYCRKNL